MIRILGDMPAGVLGFEAVDDVEKEDYENVIVPVMNEAIAEHGKVRVVYVQGPELDDYAGGAVWEDLKVRGASPRILRAGRDRDRCALRRPDRQDLQRALARTARVFPLAELEPAKRWAAEVTG